MDILSLSAVETAKKIKSGELSVREVLDAVFTAIDEKDKKYNCFISLCREEAYARAERIQAQIDAGEVLSPLAGVPIAVKDNICTKGIKTTCASKMLENFEPTYNAHVIDLIEKAGLIVVGKLNMDEFAMGSTTETSTFGETLNPWDITRVPGGSSGGAAAAVAAGEVLLALGSDTGGSIRQPSSFCGVTGLKPTYGSVSRRGLVAFASSLDQIGPIARSAEDCAALMSIISGRDERDSTSMDSEPVCLEKVKDYSLKGKKIGIPKEFFGEGLQPDTKEAVLSAARELESLGADTEEFDMPISKYAIPTYYIIACAEACSNLSRYDGIKYGYRSQNAEDLLDTYVKSRSEGFGMEVKRRIMLGNFVLSSGYYDAYYKKALQAKKLIQSAFFDAFEKYDFILGPVYPTTALRLHENLSDPLKMYLGDIYTVMINLAGLPAVSVPCGFDADGMPIGLQFIGRPFGEEGLMGAAHSLQQINRAYAKTAGGEK